MGVTFSLPEKDRYGYAQRYLHATMRVLCGGRLAEARKTGDISSGASMDIKMVTTYARAMVLEWGMSERLGNLTYGKALTGRFLQSAFLEALERLLGFFQQLATPRDQLAAEVFLLARIHERFFVGGPIVRRNRDRHV